jgi:protein-disulfide isomerase
MKNPWVIIGIITVVLFGGAVWFSNSSGESNNEGVVVIEHIKGNPDAAVELVEYSDFQCPACASFQPVLNEVMTTYGENVKLVYKHFPLPIHPFAQQAAMAAEAAGQQGKFFEYHDALFANQQEWSRSRTPSVLFLQYANDLGLDMDLFRRHVKSSVLREHVQSHLAETRELGLTGTPSFFLNGERMQIQTFEDFVSQIAQAVDPSAAASVDGAVVPSQPEVRFGI